MERSEDEYFKSNQALNFRDLYTHSARPDFMIIGAQKAGTTALHEMLAQHPDIASSSKKELHYFDNDEWYNPDDHRAYEKHFTYLKWKKRPSLFFESTPIYLYVPCVPERLHNYHSDLKLITVLREPVSRAVSAWTMFHHNFEQAHRMHQRDRRSFEEAINEDIDNLDRLSEDEDRKSYIRRGIYQPQLSRFMETFGENKLLIIESNELKSNPQSTCDRITAFLGVSEFNFRTVESNKASNDNPRVDPATIERLKAFYEPHNERLFTLIGQRYNW